jgi:shikimate dehydrogenase
LSPSSLPRRLVLFGHPVAHSLSPAFQNAALRAAGIPLTYELLDVPPEQLAAAFHAVCAAGGAGNVTIPHKEAVRALCTRLTHIAQRVGAVNTFWIDDDREVVGDNTDVIGFNALADAVGVRRESSVVAIIGSGGSAAAVCAAVEQWPDARIVLLARSRERASALADRFGARVQLAESQGDAIARAQLVVNATPIGLRSDDVPIAVELLARDARVMDLVYRPGETRWVRDARQAGHVAADGREMLLLQGAAAFERWFARPPDLEVMRSALQEAAGA